LHILTLLRLKRSHLVKLLIFQEQGFWRLQNLLLGQHGRLQSFLNRGVALDLLKSDLSQVELLVHFLERVEESTQLLQGNQEILLGHQQLFLFGGL